MSSGLSSDQIIKMDIVEQLGYSVKDIRLRIFPESSNFDQKIFSQGGLTFGINNVAYGSCDAAWYIDGKEFTDPYDGSVVNEYPVIALEGTDALTRGSSGNAQYQRFHHALGATKSGVIGVYYLRPGKESLRLDLLRMAYCASLKEKGYYLIVQDLKIIKDLLSLIANYGLESAQTKTFLDNYIEEMNEFWTKNCFSKYNHDWNKFAKKRSTIIKPDYIIKHAGRMKRNFTDGSQRAGHIAVGEMFLTKYFFEEKEILYLFPKMTREEIIYLDANKKDDKEWHLLRNEPNITIITMDELIGLPIDVKNTLIQIKDEPLKGSVLRSYNACVKTIVDMINSDKISINPSYLP